MDRLTRSGLVLGLGMGGFVDGIVLHQILGWHHLICKTEHCQAATVAQMKVQQTQDGFFHLAVWILVLVGIILLFQAGKTAAQGWSGQKLAGGMLAGFGLFNFVEGMVDHQMLGIHHVLPGHPHEFLFDMLFLASGLALLASGAILCRRGRVA